MRCPSSNGDKGKANADVAQTYQPFSLPLLLKRLSTYSVSTYSHKPSSCKNLNAVTLAMQGWYHESGHERDVITCATCKAQWKVQIAEKLSHEEQAAAWQILDQSILSKHVQWCPWRLRRCHCESLRPCRVDLEVALIFLLIQLRYSRCLFTAS